MTPEPDWVDLGLPSGILWAKANLGATLPESAGVFFSWGNTEGHPAGAGYDFSQAVYAETPGAAITGNLSLAQDAARVNLGAPWRMPTAAEFQELYINCTHVYTTLNGVNGLLFTSNVNGKTLFFPVAGLYDGTSRVYASSQGFYWSSSYFSATDAQIMDFNPTTANPNGHNSRRFGFSIRAVRSA